jgi:hypothetical protein
MRTVLGIIAFLLAVGIATYLVRAVGEAREAARRSQCSGYCCQILVALHNYHDTYGMFPPAYIADATGKPMHSWRMLILPYLNGQDLYQQYRFHEPWNSDHNVQIAGQLKPNWFRCPSCPSGVDPRITNYVVITGTGTAFPGATSAKLDDFADGTDNTILFAETSTSNILWTEPADLVVDQMSFAINDPKRPSISSAHSRGPAVVLANGCRTYRPNKSTDPETLRALTTIAGQEPVAPASLIQSTK